MSSGGGTEGPPADDLARLLRDTMFEVFRRHQRKLLAVFAIFAMFAFVVSDSLPRLLSGGTGSPRDNVEVATLHGRTVRRSDLQDVAARRMYANQFMGNLVYFLSGRPPAGPFFGDVSERALVDALILDHEADRLGLPEGADFGRRWLSERTRQAGQPMTREVFQFAMAPLAEQLTGEQVLDSIAAEARRLQVRSLMGTALVTPLDVFDSYRDQRERIAVRAAAFAAERFLDRVSEPSAADLQAFYDAHKDDLPDPERDTPGFKVPRQVRVEYLSIDGAQLAREIREKLTDEELRTAYENRKNEFIIPSDLPADVFADDPNATLTPPLSQPFDQVRDILAGSLAEERAEEEIEDRFERVRLEALYEFADAYREKVEEAEAGARGKAVDVPAPKPNDLGPVAAREGLEREVTPPLTRETAATYGRIGEAEAGIRRPTGVGRRFVDEAFDPKNRLFEPFEMAGLDGRRYLARKVEDTPPRVPPLDEIRDQVARAWKLEKARDLARKAAEEYAESVRKAGGKLSDEIVEGRPVIVTASSSRMQPGAFRMEPFPQMGPPTPSLLPEFDRPGDDLRDAMFGLAEGEVAVAPNAPKTVYYVLAVEERDPASVDGLFGIGSTYSIHQGEAISEAAAARETAWMQRLRAEAGIPTGWVPPDEQERDPDRA